MFHLDGIRRTDTREEVGRNKGICREGALTENTIENEGHARVGLGRQLLEKGRRWFEFRGNTCDIGNSLILENGEGEPPVLDGADTVDDIPCIDDGPCLGSGGGGQEDSPLIGWGFRIDLVGESGAVGGRVVLEEPGADGAP